MKISLRHARIVLAVHESRSVTLAAARCHVSQPAVSAAVTQIEVALGTPIFLRGRAGFTPTPAGEAVTLRFQRAMAWLDPALSALAPRLIRTATVAQLNALIAVAECESFSAAARRLNIAQPTVHRAISQLEREVGQPLFDRTAKAVIPTRAVRHLATVARLAFAEMNLAEADVGALSGREVGRVVIGAMPLARAALLGPAIAVFRKRWKTLPVRVVDGPYAELVLALRRGEMDLLVGALRPATADLTQEVLFQDEMAIVTRPGHPLAQGAAQPADMMAYPWVVAAEGTPARDHFAAMFHTARLPIPESLVETGSMALLSHLVGTSDHLGFISARQVARDVAQGTLVRLPFQPTGTLRPIGLTTRSEWRPTQAQGDMLDALRAVAV